MAIILDGSHLTIEQLVAIARNGEKVELCPKALERIKLCRAMLEEKVAKREIMYGVNTGIGEFSEVVLADDQIEQFQRWLVYNHSAGIGDPAPIEHVRAAMTARINVHAHGNSGCRPEIPQTFVAMLNKGVTPFVCKKGSVGACGDLAPMSQIALTLLGEGQAYYKGELLPAKTAFEKAGIPVPGLKARDGLAAINGSNLLTSISALTLYDADRWLKQAEIAASMSLEALLANMKPYHTKLHELRGFAGAVRSAAAIRKCVAGSDLLTGKVKTKVQDAYSMRSTPQVIGAAHDAIRWARSQVETELNGVGDNPIFIPEEKLTLSGANFQGTPVSLPMEMVGQAITMVSVLSERRMNRLNNPALSVGLPPFLTKNPGMFSGLMLSQYTADTLIVEQRILSSPAATQSIPAAADQEDFVSMGMNTALKNLQILDNANGVIGIEFMAAAQALD
ncbi:MAG TPA: aromatic amino acid ammonia-lyase, partial [bacterium]|nr:aromatic amino acid ammonia-lyase [bacterium]